MCIGSALRRSCFASLGSAVRVPSSPPKNRWSEALIERRIVEQPDGLRVEGGSVCGVVCGNGAVYIVSSSENGFEVTGTDDSYGSWVA
jgi:hypothetical protein